MRREDPLIVGGGPAGTAAAIALARGRAKPTILERNRETGDALCGGFLSWRTLETLASLGLESPGGHPVYELALFAGKAIARARLPHPAVGISRHSLDSQLLSLAEGAGAAVERGVTVRELLEGGAIRLGDGAQLHPESLFLATGKHDLRGCARPRDEGEEMTLGLRVRLAAHPALTKLSGGRIELHLFDRGYCGLVLQEGEGGNLCMAIRKSLLTEAGGDPEALIARLAVENPALGERIAFAQSGPVEAISAVPYGWQAPETRPGLFRLGDQAAVIPSLAGEGNGIALASGIAAAKFWLEGGAAAAPAFQRRFARAATPPVRTAMRLWHIGERPLAAGLAVRLAALAPSLAAHFAAMTRIET